jgi:hypothetical protein
MSFKSLALLLYLFFGSVLPIFGIVFSFLEFTKFLVMVVRLIKLVFTLHTILNLQQRSRTNRTLVLISQSEFIMLLCLEEIMNKI